MGRKGRFPKQRLHKVRTRAEVSEGPSRATVRMALGLTAIVALVLMTVVLLNPSWYNHSNTTPHQTIHPNPHHVLPLPIASAIPSQVFVGENITFDGSSSHPFGSSYITNYTWEFHKLNLSGLVLMKRYERKFNFSYDKAIIFYVVLTVMDDNGLSNSTISKNRLGGLTVVIRNKMPIAEAGPDLKALTGTPFQVDGSKSYDTLGKIVNYTWDFGDGIKGYGEWANHTYAHLGSYYVILTIIDDRGYDNWDTVKVDVVA